MHLSIVIVSWNTVDLLDKCLESIYTYPPDCSFEVIVVDNASTDPSVAMVQTKYPCTILLENKMNIGFARANNQAIERSTGHYVLLLNPDTEVKSGALQKLVDFLEENPPVGAVGSLILNPDETLQTSCYPVPTLSREFWRLFHLDSLRPYGSYRMADWALNTPREVDVLLGACLMVRREVLEQIGLLDEDYFIYSEEVDLCSRMQQAGWQLYWVPEAQVIHYGGQSTQQVAAEMFLRLYQGKLLYFIKHHGKLAALVYKIILGSAALVRLLVAPLAWLERPPQRQQHLRLASNYCRLLKSLPRL